MKWLDRVIRDWRISRALPRLAKADRVLDYTIIGAGTVITVATTIITLSTWGDAESR